MSPLVNFVTPLHKKASRDYLARMVNRKVECMGVAKQYGFDYWDGDRSYGYGGYKYDGRWSVVAKSMIEHYQLPKNARILDVGCGKAFLLYELKKLLPEAQMVGFDISKHGIDDTPEPLRGNLFIHRAQDKYPFAEKEFDLVISITTLHNLNGVSIQYIYAYLSENRIIWSYTSFPISGNLSYYDTRSDSGPMIIYAQLPEVSHNVNNNLCILA